MKKLSSILLIIACTVNGAFCQEVFKTEKIIESEAGKLSGSMQRYSGGDASGGFYLMNHYTVTKRLDDPEQQSFTDVSYNIEVPSTSDYYIWLRVRVPVSGNKVFGRYLSIYLGTDNSNYNACQVMVNKSWEWQCIASLRLKKGTHTLDFKHKDFGFGIDQMFITFTGANLAGLGMNPSREDLLKANRNEMSPISYPSLTEKDGLGMDFPKPPSGHPRLFFSQADLDNLLKKSGVPVMQTAWNKILAAAKTETTGLLDAPGDGLANFTLETVNPIEAKALMYALYKDKAQGRNAIDAMINFFNTLKFNPSTSDIYRLYGRFMLSGAMVYDWCYDLLTADEKKALIGWMETMAAGMEIGWPAIKQGAVCGHASEFQLMRDIMAMSIAIYDEKPEAYNLAAGRFFKYWVPVRKFFYPAGFHHQGVAYGGYRFMTELYATALFKGMGYRNVFGSEQGRVPYYAIYNRRPDGQIMRDGDDYVSKRAEGYWTNNGASDILAASFFKDPFIMGEALREVKAPGNSNDYIFEFLTFDPSVESQPVDKLPLAKYFPGPLGAIVARTGWESGKEAGTAVAVMKIGEYQFLNHQHLDAGSFQLYYKGALASEGGYYDAYGSDHDYNYNKRTIAHNTMLIYDPSEVIRKNSGNDGGQRFPNDGKDAADLEMLLSGDYKVASIMAHEIGPDTMKPQFTYLKGDLAKAYSTKVKEFQRSFVFLNTGEKDHPAILVVYDRVTSSDKSFKKSWLLHSIEEPIINGNEATIRRTRKGYGGRLINTTLLPQTGNLQITKVGGPGHEAEVNGINHPAKNLPDPMKSCDESGDWRIEVSPAKAALSDTYLNVMQVSDNNESVKPLTVKKIVTAGHTGTEAGGSIVLFSTSGSKVSGKINLTISGTEQKKVLIADLDEGIWYVQKEGEKTKSQYNVTKEGSVIYFTALPGKYLIYM
jgi:hypothetical protein